MFLCLRLYFFCLYSLVSIYQVTDVSFFSPYNLHKGVSIILLILHCTIFVFIIFSWDAKISVSVSILGSLSLIHSQVFVLSAFSGTSRTNRTYSLLQSIYSDIYLSFAFKIILLTSFSLLNMSLLLTTVKHFLAAFSTHNVKLFSTDLTNFISCRTPFCLGK